VTETKVMLDTNILIDAVVSSRPEHHAAIDLFSLCVDRRVRGCVLASSLKDFYYICRRYIPEPDPRGAAIRVFLEILDVVPLGRDACELALDLPEPDLEDAMVLAAARLSDVDIICSRDRRAFGEGGIPSMTAAQVLSAMGC